MLMTFDFVMHAWRDERLMSKFRKCIEQEQNSELHTDIYRISFNAQRRTVDIQPFSSTSPFAYKIIPMRITYSALIKMLDDKFEDIEEGEIVRI